MDLRPLDDSTIERVAPPFVEVIDRATVLGGLSGHSRGSTLQALQPFGELPPAKER